MKKRLSKNNIEFLTPDLLNDLEKLSEIDYWLSVMNRPQGWHYDMDIIWLLNELDNAGIKQGATILDAGAGMGITQFILASRGYNILSLDFSPRSKPPLAKGIFDIKIFDQKKLDYQHDYIGFVDYDNNKEVRRENFINILFSKTYKLKGFSLSNFYYLAKQKIQERHRLKINKHEKMNDHTNFGSIRFIRAAFHSLPIKDQEVDALVSVSAIEHADPKLMNKNINEMKRVVKRGNPLLITTSGTAENEDWFHEKTKGWCFSQKTLSKMIDANLEISYGPEYAEKSILDSDLWRKRIDPYYANDKESAFYQHKVKSLPYLPVGIKIIS